MWMLQRRLQKKQRTQTQQPRRNDASDDPHDDDDNYNNDDTVTTTIMDPAERMACEHAKRLARILQYIASMHQSLNNTSTTSNTSNTIIRTNHPSGSASSDPLSVPLSSYRVLFSASQFRKVLALLARTRPYSNSNHFTYHNKTKSRYQLPLKKKKKKDGNEEDNEESIIASSTEFFSFYAASAASSSSSTTSSSRLSFLGKRKARSEGKTRSCWEKPCWLRLTRPADPLSLSSSPPSFCDSASEQYQQQQQQHQARLRLVLQQLLESMYHRLFDYCQQGKGGTAAIDHKGPYHSTSTSTKTPSSISMCLDNDNTTDDELIWGLGMAYTTTTLTTTPMTAATTAYPATEGNTHSNTTNVWTHGPLLEVQVEVELAREDGALLVRPREHAGVRLNREVLQAILQMHHGHTTHHNNNTSNTNPYAGSYRNSSITSTTTTAAPAAAAASSSSSSSSGFLTRLYRDVAEIDPSLLAPGQPNTYVPLLQRIARELSARGVFVPSNQFDGNHLGQDHDDNGHDMMDVDGIFPSPSLSVPVAAAAAAAAVSTPHNNSKLVLTDAWCVYARPKAASILARDAADWAERILRLSSCRRRNSLKSNPTVQPEDVTTPLTISDSTNTLIPTAAWSLTHGPSELERAIQRNHQLQSLQHQQLQNAAPWGRAFQSFTHWIFSNPPALQPPPTIELESSSPCSRKHNISNRNSNNNNNHILFALPSSDAQHCIADLLLHQHAPAVVCEGPPGTGKTHTIANLIGAYLCQGKRVLVTSKSVHALSVVRQRLPPQSVRSLCVDVSTSEGTGMRQLQSTVERLCHRISQTNAEMEAEKCEFLQKCRTALESQLQEMDDQLSQQTDDVREVLRSPSGKRMVDLALTLHNEAPWLLKTARTWDNKDLKALSDSISSFIVHLDEMDESGLAVTGYVVPPDPALIALCASNAGSVWSTLSWTSRKAMASIPIVGSLSGASARVNTLDQDMKKVKLNGEEPASPSDWSIVVGALNHSLMADRFQQQTWHALRRKHVWPEVDFQNPTSLRDLTRLFQNTVAFQSLIVNMNVLDHITAAANCRALDKRRAQVCLQIQRLAEDLVDATVVSKLSRSFSPDSHSALIQFSQLAGRAKFSRSSSQASKMSQRQKRRRQEYLDSFDRCCRLIPCWILSTSQISEYLPPECLFDLVILDEASQSDITVLPGMLRGKQWLIVGDGKQVSPTESFVSEEQIESLRAALPYSPLQNSFLPGQSFFDLCTQAFPKGRVVLREHFRCGEEIIAFSNMHFYDGSLVPLRLPTKSERLVPSLVDVRIPDGLKRGKVNENEAIKIVELIQQLVQDPEVSMKSRSIGVISLMGNDQSRLIRGRLLDVVGPVKIARHNIMIGDPPMFQGAERDIIFLSMVCSKGNVPTQNQLMHAQRVNVALSRARDRCVLVRSIDISDVPSIDDIKIPIIEFFSNRAYNQDSSNASDDDDDDDCDDNDSNKDIKNASLVSRILRKWLIEHGLTVREMGEVWRRGICVEQPNGDSRVALIIDGEGTTETSSEWRSSFLQQKAIERVGWKCMRLDALSLLVYPDKSLDSVHEFLINSGMQPCRPSQEVVITSNLDEIESMESSGDSIPLKNNSNDAVVVVDDDDDDDAAIVYHNETIAASAFGKIVNLDFLVPPQSKHAFSCSHHREGSGDGEYLEESDGVAKQGDLSDVGDDNPQRYRKKSCRMDD